MAHRLAVATLALCAACSKSNEDTALYVGGGVLADARLTSDTYTWDCTETGASADYMGVFGFDIAVEFVPDALPPRDLPPVGSCSYGLSMFAVDVLVSGTAIPGAGTPGWKTDEEEGELEQVLDGLYFADVFKNVLTCRTVDDVITSGVELTDAGVLDGVTSPTAGTVESVVSGSIYDVGIPFGDETELSWEASGWEESFVQIRRVRNNVAYETVTCNTTGATSFDLNDDVWGLLSEELTVDVNFLYVGFQNKGEVPTDYGQIVEVASRALHVVGITEI